jgi:hypothetical protein
VNTSVNAPAAAKSAVGRIDYCIAFNLGYILSYYMKRHTRFPFLLSHFLKKKKLPIGAAASSLLHV